MTSKYRYSDLDAIKAEVGEMSSKHYEGKVNGVWVSILSHHFPLTDGYVHRPQEKTRRGFSDVFSVHWVPRPEDSNLQQCRFLITQCKRPGKESKGREWEKAAGQLEDYLKAQQAQKA